MSDFLELVEEDSPQPQGFDSGVSFTISTELGDGNERVWVQPAMDVSKRKVGRLVFIGGANIHDEYLTCDEAMAIGYALIRMAVQERNRKA